MRYVNAVGLAWLLATSVSCSGSGGGGEGTDPDQHDCPDSVTECIAIDIEIGGDAFADGLTCVPAHDTWSADLSGWPELSAHCTNDGTAVDLHLSLESQKEGPYALSGTLRFANASADREQKIFGTCSPRDTRIECAFRWNVLVGPNEEILEPYHAVRGVAYFPPVAPDAPTDGGASSDDAEASR